MWCGGLHTSAQKNTREAYLIQGMIFKCTEVKSAGEVLSCSMKLPVIDAEQTRHLFHVYCSVVLCGMMSYSIFHYYNNNNNNNNNKPEMDLFIKNRVI
jgi:hypothetical protein